MDFSEVGVRSRKTGLRAKENVRRDENNMEDLDDFFRDEQETLVNQEEQRSNVRNTFHNNNEKILDFPLKSPLRSGKLLFERRQIPQTEETETNEDEYADAREEPMIEGNDSDDMEIDDESRGEIKAVNKGYENSNGDGYKGFDFDFGTPHVVQSPIETSNSTNSGQRLFVSSDEDTDRSITKSKARREVERNISMRKSTSSNGSRSHVNEVTDMGSPLKSSLLHSPLQPSNVTSRSNSRPHFKPRSTVQSPSKVAPIKASSLSKNIALNRLTNAPKSVTKSVAKFSEYSDNDSLDDSYRSESSGETSENEKDIQQSSKKKRAVESESDDERLKKPVRGRSESRGRAIRKNDFRLNKFTRSDSKAKEHVVDVEELRKQQSRSASQARETERPTRRSSRVRLPPLAFWRNEKAVYQKKKGEVVPTLQKVVTVDEVVTPIRSRAPSRAASRKTSRAPSLTRRPRKLPKIDHIIEEEEEEQDDGDGDGDVKGQEVETEDEEINGNNRGTEWLNTGFLKIDAFEGHGSDIKSKRLVAWAPGTENFSQSIISDSDNFKLAILFDKNREFIATGMMLIPPGGQKSLKGTDSTYFVFYCISGLVEVTLSGNTFMIKKGCSLEIPMGNFYQFLNKGKKDATLFFVQTRGHEVDDWDE